ncbi:hypothetical protein P691DRAFT_228936 [Macrolepiota fuliginosa MF-IS2]|uniref:Ricin B lectin domain-containing protein n=1 Tax=Macrolepiota fuliginosa MF-IS2 TaxID=1400762 RepID=A0A9P6C014_9AGAR|nr:hypothetical protein P691DRAFT_228936 [Macrolepiota fuliginosa MF-IS2]
MSAQLPRQARIVNMAGVWPKADPSHRNPDGITSPIIWNGVRTGNALEQWYLMPSGGGYEIINVATGCKAVNRGGEIVCTSETKESMIWVIQPAGNGLYTIQVPNQRIGWALRGNKVFLASVDPTNPTQRFAFAA